MHQKAFKEWNLLTLYNPAMPKKPIDYSSTYLYKIVCKNTNIEDFYIGHTTDMKTRKGCHKRTCNNPNDSNHHLPLYKFIRNNEGWNNFDMIWIETQNLQNGMEARARERQLIEQLKPSLNTNIPYRTLEEKKNYKKRMD